MKPHPIAETLPNMSGGELENLTADIKEHGLLHPLIVYEGQILDGRHRFKACETAGVEPRYTEFRGDDAGAVALVFSANLARRQLTKSQLALSGAKLKGWYAARAKERQLAALETSGKRGGKVRMNSPQPLLEGRTRDLASKVVGVGGQMIDRAETVLKNAVPEIIALVQGGEMALNEAQHIAKLSKTVQRRIAEQPTKKRRVSARHRSMGKSIAGKQRFSGRIIPQPSDAPGTALVRTLLSRLELLTNEIDKSKLSPEKFAEQFVNEFDWGDRLLVNRLAYVNRSVVMISKLALMSERAKRDAA